MGIKGEVAELSDEVNTEGKRELKAKFWAWD